MRIAPLLSAIVLLAAPAAAQGGFLGVQLGERAPDAEPPGALVAEVQDRSAAALMGLQSGDLVVAVGDVEITSAEDLARTVGARLPGEIVDLKVVRGDQEIRITGVLGRRPGDAQVRGGAPLPPTPPQAPAVPEEWPQGQEWERRLEREMQRMHEQLERQLQQLEQLHGRHGFVMPEMPRMPQMPQMPRMHGLPGMPQFEFHVMPGPGGGFGDAWDWDVRTEDGAEVKLRYPGDTPEDERQKLIEEAREKYGEDVEVEFEGEGRSISIRHSRNLEWSQPGPRDHDDPDEEEL